MFDNKQDLHAEVEWYDRGKFYIDSGHWTSHSLFASRERHWLSGEIEKIRFYGYLSKYIADKTYYQKAKVLIAPIGTGYEIKHLQGLYDSIHGIDISEKALGQCPSHVHTKKADILHSGEMKESYDVIICPLFLHHVHKVGFSPFLIEYYRILRGAISSRKKIGPDKLVCKKSRILFRRPGKTRGRVYSTVPLFRSGSYRTSVSV